MRVQPPEREDDMEDRMTPALYLELTDLEPEAYRETRASRVARPTRRESGVVVA